MDGLHILLQDLQSEAKLHSVGSIAASRDALTLLHNRLRLVDDRKRHKEIAAQEVRRPLFIVGLPRTGTTLLHRLLAQDHGNRVPLTWEILHPSPPPRSSEQTSDPRIAQTQRELRRLEHLAPQFTRIHRVGAQLPEECIAIMGQSFASDRFPAMYRVPNYQAWFERHDLRAAYADHRRFLQQLQWHHPGRRWLLKAPAHLFALDALFATYPNAVIIQTHRDPVRVIASLASLITTLHSAFSDAEDPIETGQNVARRWSEALRRGIATRDGPNAGNFIDIHYRALIDDPLGVVRHIYSRLGEQLSAQTEARMRNFLAENPQNRFGRHRYTLSSFGLDRHAERERYRNYKARFDVPDEDEDGS